MATAIVTVLLTFVLTGFIANWLAQRWQHRNWLNQQQVLGEEKEYLELRKLSEELSALSGKRFSKMQRLAAVLRHEDDAIVRQRLSEYDSTLADWNSAFNSFTVRLTLYAKWNLTWDLEHVVQRHFSELGHELERLTKARLNAQEVQRRVVSEFDLKMRSFSNTLFQFNRDVLHLVRLQKVRTYYGAPLHLTRKSINKFSAWELFKALFQSGIEPYSVIRTPSELGPPQIGGDQWPRIDQHGR
jgi:hypothetical protein